MSYFAVGQQVRLARSLVTKASPAYVQYYVTARCNLACRQCNIVYADAERPELAIDDVRRVAANLAEIGTCVVLLIGGEPFVRTDLAQIVAAFTSVGIHVRLQTAGLASRDALERCVAAGARDISISLDTLDPALQDEINGGFPGSWDRAVEAMAHVAATFPENGTAFFGTVVMPANFRDVPAVVRFATAIGWSVSLVPVHATPSHRPRGFRVTDDDGRFAFPPERHGALRGMLDDVRRLRDAGQHLYDSDEYLDDVLRFLVGEPVRWRRRNGGVCDSPSLYFAVDPSGHLDPCCDYRLARPFPVHHRDFPRWYREGRVHDAVRPYTETCEGCMYGSYPEITVTSRFVRPLLRRARFFLAGERPAIRRLDADAIRAVASEVRHAAAAS